jgi:glycerol-3-phosphate dehydrogenase
MVVDLLRCAGLELEPLDALAIVPRPVHFASLPRERQAELAAADPGYGRIACRCELVTEAEVSAAIARGARTLDGIKFRTRAGMGRCQGGFCTARCMEVLSRELDVPLSAITKRGGDSWMVLGRDDMTAEGSA